VEVLVPNRVVELDDHEQAHASDISDDRVSPERFRRRVLDKAFPLDDPDVRRGRPSEPFGIRDSTAAKVRVLRSMVVGTRALCWAGMTDMSMLGHRGDVYGCMTWHTKMVADARLRTARRSYPSTTPITCASPTPTP